MTSNRSQSVVLPTIPDFYGSHSPFHHSQIVTALASRITSPTPLNWFLCYKLYFSRLSTKRASFFFSLRSLVRPSAKWDLIRFHTPRNSTLKWKLRLLLTNKNLLMPDGRWTTREYMVTIALCKKVTQPSQACSEEGHTLTCSCY